MGDRHLQEAVDEFEASGNEVSVRYKPYMIDTRTAKGGEDRAAYCKRRWGGSGWAPNFNKWDWWPNTLNAHRLCVYLDELDAANISLDKKTREQRSLNLVKKFYELTYDRGMNISTAAGAAVAIEELGFGTTAEGEEWLNTGGGFDKVLQEDTRAKRDMDISGVPHFVIANANGRSVQTLGGAQKSKAFLAAFQKATR